MIRDPNDLSMGRFTESVVEGATLAALHDALLPKLISGETRIEDVAAIIGEAS